MNPRAVVASVVVSAVLLVVGATGSSPAARPVPDTRNPDLLASAHPTSARPTVSDDAFDVTRLRGFDASADTAALTSTTCDACDGQSTALHVVYAPRSQRVGLDNVATAWAQECTGCVSTALSVQVAVVRSGLAVSPNNRALAVNVACQGCHTAALAFQVVMATEHPEPMSDAELAALQAWVADQETALRAIVSAAPTEEPTSTPAPTSPSLTSAPPETPAATPRRTARRQAASALDDLTRLLTDALGAEPVSRDVAISR